MKDNEEEVVGHVVPSVDPEIVGNVITILGGQFSHFYCPNCNKKPIGIHCLAGRKKDEEGIVMVKDRCNNNNCECKCRRKYDYEGRLYYYGTEPKTEVDTDIPRTENDDFIDNFNQEWNKLQEKNNTIKNDSKP